MATREKERAGAAVGLQLDRALAQARKGEGKGQATSWAGGEARPVRAPAEEKEVGPEREKKERKWANGLLG